MVAPRSGNVKTDPRLEKWLETAKDDDTASVILIFRSADVHESRLPRLIDYPNQALWRQACIEMRQIEREADLQHAFKILHALNLRVKELPALGLAVVTGTPNGILCALEVPGVEGASWNGEKKIAAPKKDPGNAA